MVDRLDYIPLKQSDIPFRSISLLAAEPKISIAFLAAAVVAALFTAVFVAFGLSVPAEETVAPLTTTFPFTFAAVLAVAVIFFAVGFAGTGAFLVSVRPIFFTTVAVVVALFELCSEVFDRIEACEAVLCGDSVGSEGTEVLVRVASAGRGGGSIFPAGEPSAWMIVPVPLRVACSFSRLSGRVSLAPAAPAAA